MAYGVTCTHCGARYSLNAPLRCGLKISCAKCRKLFAVGGEGVSIDQEPNLSSSAPPPAPLKSPQVPPPTRLSTRRIRGWATATLALGLLSGLLSLVAAIPATILGLIVLSSLDRTEENLGARRRALAGLGLAFLLGLISTAAFFRHAVGLPVHQWNVEADCAGGDALFTLYGRSPRSIEKVVASFREGVWASDPRWVSTTAPAVTLGARQLRSDEDLRVQFIREGAEWEISIQKDGRAVATESSLTRTGKRMILKHDAIARPPR